MNILFLTTGRMDNIEQRSLYPDLLRCFRDKGHNIYTVSSYEKREERETELINENGAHMLHVKIGNLTQTNKIEKGFSTLRIEKQYLDAIKKYFANIKFDLVMYSTPPITLVKVIEFLKKRDYCQTYLLLKDIFPQNAVDLGMLRKTGIKGLLYRFFRNKEQSLYKISDYIGCMSQANVDYIVENNPELNPEIVEICPNCIDVIDMSVNDDTRKTIREKYNLPQDKKIFIYGGNLGKPQGIDFMISCLRSQAYNEKYFFLIVGAGTEFDKLQAYIDKEMPLNVKLLKRIPKEDYDAMVGACDVGLIFLDHRFTIPNFPSRLLAYMQAKLPVLAVTDPHSDVGKVVVDGGFGWWCESNDIDGFSKLISKINFEKIEMQKDIEFFYLVNNYSVERAYSIIMKHFSK